MDLCYPNSGATELSGANPFLGCFRKLCNNLQNVVAITYIFALQQPTFLVCNFLHFYFTINKLTEYVLDTLNEHTDAISTSEGILCKVF